MTDRIEGDVAALAAYYDEVVPTTERVGEAAADYEEALAAFRDAEPNDLGGPALLDLAEELRASIERLDRLDRVPGRFAAGLVDADRFDPRDGELSEWLAPGAQTGLLALRASGVADGLTKLTRPVIHLGRAAYHAPRRDEYALARRAALGPRPKSVLADARLQRRGASLKLSRPVLAGHRAHTRAAAAATRAARANAPLTQFAERVAAGPVGKVARGAGVGLAGVGVLASGWSAIDAAQEGKAGEAIAHTPGAAEGVSEVASAAVDALADGAASVSESLGSLAGA